MSKHFLFSLNTNEEYFPDLEQSNILDILYIRKCFSKNGVYGVLQILLWRDVCVDLPISSLALLDLECELVE